MKFGNNRSWECHLRDTWWFSNGGSRSYFLYQLDKKLALVLVINPSIANHFFRSLGWCFSWLKIFSLLLTNTSNNDVLTLAMMDSGSADIKPSVDSGGSLDFFNKSFKNSSA
mmetsp:Transcript_1176/g.2687  ORF Transcript_1176/g.2687 Transcript_1176/m.2687 type:complete len:112 (+) Transcript_1176:924-1259(+)